MLREIQVLILPLLWLVILLLLILQEVQFKAIHQERHLCLAAMGWQQLKMLLLLLIKLEKVLHGILLLIQEQLKKFQVVIRLHSKMVKISALHNLVQLLL